MTKYFVDTEFIDDGKTIDLISIGVACEDGRELYLQSCEFKPSHANEWVRQNVIPHLKQCPHIKKEPSDSPMLDLLWQIRKHPANPGPWDDRTIGGQCTFKDADKGIIVSTDDCPWRTRAQMCNEIKNFFNSEKIELWGWCSSYDHVALCQLWGTMMDVPPQFPHYMCDFQYVLDGRRISDDELPQQESGLHNALEDAKHLKRLWECVVINNTWQ